MNSQQIAGRAFIVGDNANAESILAQLARLPAGGRMPPQPASAADAWVDGPIAGITAPRPDPADAMASYAVMIAGRRFGLGRAGRRTTAVLAAAGISAVVAESFWGRDVADTLSSSYIWAFQSEYRICDAFETGDQVEVNVSLQGLRFAGSFCILPLRLAAVDIETGWLPTLTHDAESLTVGL